MGETHTQADELVSFQAMQRQLMTEAMQKGADAILVQHVGKIETGITTVENRVKETKNSRDSSSTTFSSAQIETDRVVKAQLLKYR